MTWPRSWTPWWRLSLVNALLVAVSRKKNEDLSKTFETLEKIWEEYGVYEKTLE